MVNVGDSSLQVDSSQLAWSEGRRPLGAVLHSSDEPSVLRPFKNQLCVRVIVP